MERIVVFDVETPNHQNDRICSIGITIIEEGQIAGTFSYLVNPECEFDVQNIQLHGIRSCDVAQVPAFPEIWEQLRALFQSNLVAAHNASFDLCVLRKVLSAYKITQPLLYYVDTLQIARSLVFETANHKLSTLCKHFCIPLEHHNAGSDSYACAKLLCRFIEAGANLDEYTHSCSFEAVEPGSIGGSAPFRAKLSKNSQALLTLNGILAGITCDNVLAEAEIGYLQDWLDASAALKGNYPYDKIYSTLSGALADGVLTEKELAGMLKLFKQVTDPVGLDICGCADLDIRGKTICLSGEFDCGSKEDVARKLASLGADVQNTVTLKTDLLVVGGQGSAAWSAGSYGNKVKKALEMQAKGSPILLMREVDFFAALEG